MNHSITELKIEELQSEAVHALKVIEEVLDESEIQQLHDLQVKLFSLLGAACDKVKAKLKTSSGVYRGVVHLVITNGIEDTRKYIESFNICKDFEANSGPPV